MVFFSCDGCGEMLKKNQVDAHAYKCRRCYAVSCVDCSRSFPGDEYRSHTSCMTESERYEGQFAKTKKNGNKRNPQQEWMNLVCGCISTAPGHLRNYMQTMSTLDNIPRKEKQFINFTSNSLNLRNGQRNVASELWNVLKTAREKQMAEKNNASSSSLSSQKGESTNDNGKIKTNVKKRNDDILSESSDSETKEEEKMVVKTEQPKSNHNEGTAIVKKKKKKKPTTMSELSSSKLDSKQVKKTMKKVLKKAPNKSMKIKELRKIIEDKLELSKPNRKLLKELLMDASNKNVWKTTKFKLAGKVISLE